MFTTTNVTRRLQTLLSRIAILAFLLAFAGAARAADLRVHGNGKLSMGHSPKFHMDVRVDKNGQLKGEIRFEDKDAGVEMKSTSITGLTVVPKGMGQAASISGIGTLKDGTVVNFLVYANDTNNKGHDKDVFGINIPSISYGAVALVDDGQIEIKPEDD